eukprot:8094092-Heterocapsa_arctica.AAC.1
MFHNKKQLENKQLRKQSREQQHLEEGSQKKMRISLVDHNKEITNNKKAKEPIRDQGSLGVKDSIKQLKEPLLETKPETKLKKSAGLAGNILDLI